MKPRLEVLWHREIGDRLLVALEEEPTMACAKCASEAAHEGVANWHVVPMPSGTRVELVEDCPKCEMTGYWCLVAHSAGYPPESPRHRRCQAYHVPCDRCSDGDIAGSGVISLGVVTLEEVVPWKKVARWHGGFRAGEGWYFPRDPRPYVAGCYLRDSIYDELSPLSPKYVALCDVKK